MTRTDKFDVQIYDLDIMITEMLGFIKGDPLEAAKSAKGFRNSGQGIHGFHAIFSHERIYLYLQRIFSWGMRMRITKKERPNVGLR